MRRYVLGFAAAIALLGIPTPAKAHHALQAEFAMDKRVSFTGVLTKFAAINPHVRWYFDVKNPDGTTGKWEVTAGGASALREAGLIRAFKVGDTFVVSCAPARNGSNVGRVIDFKFADGRVITLYHDDPNNPNDR